ncbi:MAG: hypothetical protein ACBR50_23735 [Microcoleus sp.]
MTGFFGWWGVLAVRRNLRNRVFLSFYAITNNSRKNPVSGHPRAQPVETGFFPMSLAVTNNFRKNPVSGHPRVANIN